MSLLLNDLVFRSIYALDNCFDDDPARFHALSNECPSSIEDVKALGRTPCGLLKGIASDSTAMRELLDTHPEFIPAFNGMSYLAYKTQEARQQCDLNNIPETREHFLALGARNFHGDLFARLVENISKKSDEHERQEDLQNMEHGFDALLAPGFVGLGETRLLPARLKEEIPAPEQEQLDEGTLQKENLALHRLQHGANRGKDIICYVHNETFAFDALAVYEFLGDDLKRSLYFESQQFPANDLLDFFADLEVEEATGAPTPNMAVNAIRCRHPELDLQAIRKEVTSHWKKAENTPPQQYAIKRGSVASQPERKIEELETLAPDLFAAIGQFCEETTSGHLLSEGHRFRFIYPSGEAKRLAREEAQQGTAR